MYSATPEIYQLAYLELKLEQALLDGLITWQNMYESALGNWELEKCRQLLGIVKRYPLDARQRGAVLHLEGLLWERWGDWATARICMERASELHREANHHRGEMVSLNALANVLRRNEERHDEAIPLYQRALEIAGALEDKQAQSGILNNLGLAQYETGNFDAATHNFEKALQRARLEGDRKREERALHNLGNLAWSQGRLADAEEQFGIALEICRELSDRAGEAETLSSLGITWEAQGQWDQATSAYRQALDALQEIGDHHGQAQVLTNLGNVAWLQERYEEAIHHYESGLTLAQSLGDAQLEGKLLGGLGDVYRSLGRFDAAEETLKLAIARKAAAGDRHSQAITYLELGALLHQTNRLDDAESAYRQALDLAHAVGDLRVPTHTQINLARLEMLRDRPDAALAHLDQAETLAQEMNYREALGDIAQLRGDILLNAGNADAAQVSRHYAEALAYDADFNTAELNKQLDYLAGLLQAIAKDGDVASAIILCENIMFLWKTAELDQPWPQVIVFLSDLKTTLETLKP